VEILLDDALACASTLNPTNRLVETTLHPGMVSLQEAFLFVEESS
jgi:hypothetical protein